jgi:hypothetical protein
MDAALNIKQFKQKLRDPSSFKIKDQLLQYFPKSFLNSLSETDSMIELKTKISNFMIMFEETLPKYNCWRSSRYTEIEEASEVVEFMVTKEKYRYFFL